MSWTCPYQWSKPMLSVCRSSSEPQPAPLCVMLQCFKRLRQPPSCQKTLSALLSLSVSILSTVAWQIKHLYSVCMCVGVSEIWRLHGEVAESTAAAQTGLPSIFSPSPLLCETIKRQKKCMTVTEKMLIKSNTNRYCCRLIPHYLLDLWVRSSRSTDLTARTGRLVNESAWGTSPLCLLGGGQLTQF